MERDEDKDHIRLIICSNSKEIAIDLIHKNGYSNTIEKAREIWDEYSFGKKRKKDKYLWGY